MRISDWSSDVCSSDLMKFYQIGEKLYRGGDRARGIPACMACHGPTGAGNPGPAYPNIGGQQSAYVVRRLEEFRTGTTTQADPHLFKVMATVAKPLSDEEIQAPASNPQGMHATRAQPRTPHPPTPKSNR